MDSLVRNSASINEMLTRYGVKFGLYKNGSFHEQIFPFDPIARTIEADEWKELSAGLAQRVRALNAFLQDIYGQKRIITDGVIPPKFVFSSPGFLKACDGVTPPGGVYAHIAGIDLVQAHDKSWYVLEDNLRIPSGASYPLIAREICRRASPQTFRTANIIDNRRYPEMLSRMMQSVACDGICVVMTPGRYNAAFFEHSYLSEKTGFALAVNDDLFVEDNCLYYRDCAQGKVRVERFIAAFPTSILIRLRSCRKASSACRALWMPTERAMWRSSTRPATAWPTIKAFITSFPKWSNTTWEKKRS